MHIENTLGRYYEHKELGPEKGKILNMFEYVKLKELCTVNQGLQIPISKRMKEPGPNRYFYITVQFLKNNIENYYIENPPIATTCCKDEILMVRTGNTGQVITGVEGCFHNNFFKVKPNERIISKYMFYVLKSDLMYKRILNAASGTTIPDLKHSSFYELDIPLPTIEIQRKISDLLECIDKKIETNSEINRNLEEQAQTIIDEVFGQYAVASVKSDMSELPVGWSYCRLDDLCKHIKPGTNYQPQRVEEGIPFLNVRCINSGYIDTSDAKFITEEEYLHVHKNWKPEKNDLLISRIGTIGLVAVIRCEDLPIAVHYNFINIKADKLPFEFMYFFLKSKEFQKAYHLIKKQSVQEYVTIDEVADLKIALPDIKTIDFNQYRDIYKMIVTNQREQRRLIEIRDSLLPKLMLGELDVSDLEI